MKRLLSIPLRVILPALLVSCAAAAGLISWKLNARALGNESEAQFLDEARLRITALQSDLEDYFRKRDAGGVDLAVSGMATRNDVLAAFVLDPQDRVVAATRRAMVGHVADAIGADLPEDFKDPPAVMIAQVRASGNGRMVLSLDRRIAVAYYPLAVEVNDHALRPTRNGVVVLALDTQLARARALRAAGRQARDNLLVFGGLAAFAWVFIHLGLTGRVAGLVATTRRLAAGDRTARTGIDGSDELAQVARALDSMADRIAEDILRREQVEEELRESEARLQVAMHASNLGPWDWNLITNQVHFSPEWKRQLGFSDEEIAGHFDEFRTRLHPEDDDRIMSAVQAFMADRDRGYDVEFRLRHKDGFYRWIHTRGTLLFDAADKPCRMLGCHLDITERKRSEAELANAHKQLVETSHQAGMAEVATSVLHNVGNVLNSVNVSCSVVADKVRKSRIRSVAKTAALLREHAGDLAGFFTRDPTGQKLPDFLGSLAGRLAEEQAEVLKELQSLARNIEHIKDIVSMQQNYAKVSGVTETVQATDLVEDSLRMNDGSLLRHDVQVVREFAAVPPITVEKHKVLQILVNLIRNAKHACDESGRADKQMTVRVSHEGDRVRIAVADNGVGIPGKNLTRIFGHGFTTRQDGHGFGLHSAVLAAQEMGDRLTAQSGGPGAGATFTLELPIDLPKNNRRP